MRESVIMKVKHMDIRKVILYYYITDVNNEYLLIFTHSRCFMSLLLFFSGTKTWNSLSKERLQQRRANIVLMFGVIQTSQGEYFVYFCL